MRVMFRDARVLIFDGQQPESPDDNLSTQTLLAALTVSAVEFPDDGTLVLLTADSSPAIAGGTPTWFRIEDRRGKAILDGACGPNGDMNVEGDIEADGEVRVESIVYRESRKW